MNEKNWWIIEASVVSWDENDSYFTTHYHWYHQMYGTREDIINNAPPFLKKRFPNASELIEDDMSSDEVTAIAVQCLSANGHAKFDQDLSAFLLQEVRRKPTIHRQWKNPNKA